MIVFNNDLLVFILCKTSALVLCSFHDILNILLYSHISKASPQTLLHYYDIPIIFLMDMTGLEIFQTTLELLTPAHLYSLTMVCLGSKENFYIDNVTANKTHKQIVSSNICCRSLHKSFWHLLPIISARLQNTRERERVILKITTSPTKLQHHCKRRATGGCHEFFPASSNRNKDHLSF